MLNDRSKRKFPAMKNMPAIITKGHHFHGLIPLAPANAKAMQTSAMRSSSDFRLNERIFPIAARKMVRRFNSMKLLSEPEAMNFRIAVYAANWDVAILVQNLSDEQQFSYVGNTPLSGSLFGTNTFYSFITRPRTTYLQATYRF